jgi:hypothetical protein
MHSKAKLVSLIMWGGRPRPRNAYSTCAKNSGGPFLPALLALFTTLTPYAAAQRAPAHAAPAHSAAPHFNRPTSNFAFNQSRNSNGFRRSTPPTSLPFPLYGDSFSLDDLYASGYPVASEPPAFLLQAANALAGPADFPGHSTTFPSENSREPSPSQPLMIELQNGNYVRVNHTPADGEARPLAFSPTQAKPKSASTHSASTEKLVIPRTKLVIPSETRDPGFASTTALPPRELPPVLLIFRDGHSEEVRDFTIAEGTLYARGNYYTDGFWNKKISLATLNVSETLQANNERNVKFILPKSPNEVITRP